MEVALSDNAITTLEKRYLLRDNQGNIIEQPAELFDRVARAIAAVEKEEDRDYWYSEFSSLLESLDFLPNTPTLMNAGKEKGQLSACFVLPIEDSMHGIFTTLRDAAIIHQTGGGTGFDFSRLRPQGSMVSNKSGVSTGPISFAKVYNSATEAIKQGASRRGANMMNMRVDHPDILDFIDMKAHDNETMKNFNVSVTVTNEFMEALQNGDYYELKHPYFGGGTGERLYAPAVWHEIAAKAWGRAEPGVIFIDRVNERSPYEERIEATNPCGEQPLPPYGSCNLGSINLANFVRENGLIDWKKLRDTTRVAVRFLDNVIDANVYPLPEIEEHTKRYRNIGLGGMGWADALIKLKIPYNSQEAVDLGEKVQEFVNKVAHEYSYELAQEKGEPDAAPFKTFFSYSYAHRRNATLTTVAPTGTLCILANCSSGIEPNFAFTLEKHVMDTVLTEHHPLYAAALLNGGVEKPHFVEAHDVEPIWHVEMQAAFQRNCDSGISKTINLPESATIQDVKNAYIRAWETGCKGITVYRDKSRQGVLHRKDEPKTAEGYCEECGGELVMESGCEKCLVCNWSKCLIA